jgi:hypothetical protein
MNCSKCGGWLHESERLGVYHEVGGKKECPPSYAVWCPAERETEEGALTFRGEDEEGAARAWAQSFDEVEHPLLDSRSELEVYVKDAQGVVTRWKVRAEASIDYYADPVQ